MNGLGKNIDLYLMGSDVSGRWQAMLANWNCCVYKIPRRLMKDCDDLPEIYTPGVYFLFGKDDETDKKFVYIGESDNVAKRILQPHRFEKDGSFWTEAVIYVTPDGSLDKARIKYLENRFHSIAVEMESFVVKNGNIPTQSPVQRKTRDLLEEFILNAKIVMYALGYRVFEPNPSAKRDGLQEGLLHFSRNHGKGGKASGKLGDDGFWVLKGSYINPETASYLSAGVVKYRQRYAADIDENGILQRDICFGSPSYAAAFVCGKNSNGLAEWKNAEGKSLKELFEEDSTVEKMVKLADAFELDVNERFDKEGADRSLLHLAGKQYTAFAYFQGDRFIVKKGSQFSPEATKSCRASTMERRKSLIDDGKVVDGRFVCDETFNSPSEAASCILGRNTNGRTAWLNKEGKMLKEL